RLSTPGYAPSLDRLRFRAGAGRSSSPRGLLSSPARQARAPAAFENQLWEGNFEPVTSSTGTGRWPERATPKAVGGGTSQRPNGGAKPGASTHFAPVGAQVRPIIGPFGVPDRCLAERIAARPGLGPASKSSVGPACENVLCDVVFALEIGVK